MIWKRGKIYWYKFSWRGETIRETTKQSNGNIARTMESAHRTALAKGEVGIREKKLAPTLRDFISKRVDAWAQVQFNRSTYIRWLRPAARAILAYPPLASLRLDEITSEDASSFAAHRQSQNLGVSSVNANLRVLNRILGLAVEWGELPARPRMKYLPGEKGRDRVVSRQEEALYLAAAPEPLKTITTVMFDSGLRPDEAFRLRWEAINWQTGRYGTLMVTYGKTQAARRTLPMTPRVRTVLDDRWLSAGKPEAGFVFPRESGSGYVADETMRRMHVKATKATGVAHFVLHSIRHTFLTRLGESGCDAWTLAKVAGHSSIKVSSKYVHPSANAVENAFLRLPAAPALAAD